MGTKRLSPKGGTTIRRVAKRSLSTDSVESSCAELVGFIEHARQRAYQAVNSELVGLYWRIGEYISSKLAWPQPSGAKAWSTAWRRIWRTKCPA